MRITHSLSLTAVLVTLGLTAAHAKPGYNSYAGVNNRTCANCHSGGAAPTVSFKVAPTSLVSGQSGSFTFGVMGTLSRTEVDIAALDKNGVSIPVTPDNVTTQTAGNEVVPKGNYFSGASKDYTFSINAPANAVSPITVYAVGMASNGSGTGGDGVAKTTLQLTLSGGSSGDAGGGGSDAGPKMDGGSTSGDSGASSSSGGTSSSSSSGAVSSSSSGGASSGGASSSGGDGNAADGTGDFDDDAGGCSTSDSSRSGIAGMFGLLAMLMLVKRARRRA